MYSNLGKWKYKSAHVKKDVCGAVNMAQDFFLVATLHSIKLQDCVPSEFEDCEYIPRVTG